VVYVKTLEWIVGGACERMGPDEDFWSTHNLAAWALADELGDSVVYDRRIIKSPPVLL
jgi:hypothetical protein